MKHAIIFHTVQQQQIIINTKTPLNFWRSSVTNFDHLLNHGCWCSSLQNNEEMSLPHAEPVDELDQICKNVIQCQRCNHQTQHSCKYMVDLQIFHEKGLKIIVSKLFTHLPACTCFSPKLIFFNQKRHFKKSTVFILIRNSMRTHGYKNTLESKMVWMVQILGKSLIDVYPRTIALAGIAGVRFNLQLKFQRTGWILTSFFWRKPQFSAQQKLISKPLLGQFRSFMVNQVILGDFRVKKGDF